MDGGLGARGDAGGIQGPASHYDGQDPATRLRSRGGGGGGEGIVGVHAYQKM